MNHDEFETRLQQIPPRQPPGEWRDEIFGAASNGARFARQRSTPVGELAFTTSWRTRLSELFWPHPLAWGGIAAVWMAIGVLSAESSTNGQRPTGAPRAFHVAWQTVLLEQDQWQDELSNDTIPDKPPLTNSLIAPRSQFTMRWKMT